MKRPSVIGLVGLLGFGGVAAACGAAPPSHPASSTPVLSAALSPRPLNTVRQRILFHLTPSSSNLLVFSTAGTQAEVTVYQWTGHSWQGIFSRQSLNGTLPHDQGIGSFSLAGPARLMGGPNQAFVLDTWLAGADAGSSTVEIWAPNASGHLQDVLTLSDFGTMGVRLAGDHLVVTGNYYKNAGVCMACGTPDTVTISYHPRSRRWTGIPANFFQALTGENVSAKTATGAPSTLPSPSSSGPSLTFGGGFDATTFSLIDPGSTFPPGQVYALLTDPPGFGSLSLTWLIEEQDGAGWLTYDSGTLVLNPQDNELANPFYLWVPGVYRISFLNGNSIIAGNTVTIVAPPTPTPSATPIPSSTPTPLPPSPTPIRPSPSPSPSTPPPSFTPSSPSVVPSA
ncbi:hypothetical protein TPY_0044 [Sulfobacillus acidophilus TPY]|uniref:Uncharacterized protein n=1 Tax=Sulfobacillus acidophilus (strain ATCC 700253 / DSM 10332 / NAL) TaxID=679936 RepID=G8TV36_SULAD|nr:hypothetical protein TPY_0044 [Sulfobacillus acidophilus TPY]AEW03617.1 hypothetical protein Sulac_0042 [Sulfobacillus acidophilus DSM 10332]